MDHVNTSVVLALMSLRGISMSTLCTLAHVAHPDMSAWLYSGAESADRVDFDAQLEILKFLGIHGEAPRGDVVHYWKVTETLFSRADTAYQPLAVMLNAFGNARVAFLARESDPALLFKAKACFALQFPGFQVILEVQAHPMRSISFDPDMMQGLEWVPETMGVLLPDAQYDALEPGAMRVKHLTQYITYTTEMAHWNRLRDLANEKGIRAEQVAQVLLQVAPPPAQPVNQSLGLVPEPRTREAVTLRQVAPALRPVQSEQSRPSVAEVSPAPAVAPAAAVAPTPAVKEPSSLSPAVQGQAEEGDTLGLFVRPARTGAAR